MKKCHKKANWMWVILWPLDLLGRPSEKNLPPAKSIIQQTSLCNTVAFWAIVRTFSHQKKKQGGRSKATGGWGVACTPQKQFKKNRANEKWHSKLASSIESDQWRAEHRRQDCGASCGRRPYCVAGTVARDAAAGPREASAWHTKDSVPGGCGRGGEVHSREHNWDLVASENRGAMALQRCNALQKRVFERWIARGETVKNFCKPFPLCGTQKKRLKLCGPQRLEECFNQKRNQGH